MAGNEKTNVCSAPTTPTSRLMTSFTSEEKHDWIQNFVNVTCNTPTQIDFIKSPVTNEIITHLPDSSLDSPETTRMNNLIKKYEKLPANQLVQINFDKSNSKRENIFCDISSSQTSASTHPPEIPQCTARQLNNSKSSNDSLHSTEPYDWDTMEALFVTKRTPVRTRNLNRKKAKEIIVDDRRKQEDLPTSRNTILVISSDDEVSEDTSKFPKPSKKGKLNGADNAKNLGPFNGGECPICLGELEGKEVSATTCGHVFCTPCIQEVVRVQKKCPKCRKRIYKKNIISLYV